MIHDVQHKEEKLRKEVSLKSQLDISITLLPCTYILYVLSVHSTDDECKNLGKFSFYIDLCSYDECKIQSRVNVIKQGVT